MGDRGIQILEAAVSLIGGETRDGQLEMVQAVSSALREGSHLLVQAGTGTGKSLGYLAPVLASLGDDGEQKIAVATATLALQAQLATADIPVAVAAAKSVMAREISWAVLKGRSNYACLSKVRHGLGAEQGSLIEPSDSEVGKEVVALRAWAEECGESGELADRDRAPSHGHVAWGQVSVSSIECLGTKCPFVGECFAERARTAARSAQLIVTNHAMLAIDAAQEGQALPALDALIVDEAHELTARVSSASSADLSPQSVERLARRCRSLVDDNLLANLFEAGEALEQAFAADTLGQLSIDSPAVAALAAVRDAARSVFSSLEPDELVSGAINELFEIAERMAKLAPDDVVYLSERERFGRQAHVAPLSVAELLKTGMFARHPVVLTSATLSLGGGFKPIASAVGLAEDDSWVGLDVGSPFDYRNQGILYVARDLPTARRDGIPDEVLGEIAELLWAAGGRTLGLFSSQRAAEAAAEFCRKELPHLSIMCQGEAHLAELRDRFLAEQDSSLFGTMSLWQGIDIPGDACELVIIDKIPFPRPDDPLMQARQRAVADAGGNGFMAVAASHAALLLAQGSGRLIRRTTDRGVVAILDPRLVTARYGSFLRRSLPDFWQTTDREVAIQALKRLVATREQT